MLHSNLVKLEWTCSSRSWKLHLTHVLTKFRSLPPLIIALIPGQQRSLNKAKEMRVQLANEVAAVINEFGPKLYEDFNQVSFDAR